MSEDLNDANNGETTNTGPGSNGETTWDNLGDRLDDDRIDAQAVDAAKGIVDGKGPDYEPTADELALAEEHLQDPYYQRIMAEESETYNGAPKREWVEVAMRHARKEAAKANLYMDIAAKYGDEWTQDAENDYVEAQMQEFRGEEYKFGTSEQEAEAGIRANVSRARDNGLRPSDEAELHISLKEGQEQRALDFDKSSAKDNAETKADIAQEEADELARLARLQDLKNRLAVKEPSLQ